MSSLDRESPPPDEAMNERQRLFLEKRRLRQQTARAQSDGPEESEDSLESLVNAFWDDFRSRFQPAKEALEAVDSQSETEKALEQAKQVVQALQAQLSAATVYLPNYDQRRGHEEIAALNALIEMHERRARGKKKFSFSARRSRKGASSAAPSEPETGQEAQSVAPILQARSAPLRSGVDESSYLPEDADIPSIHGRSEETLVHTVEGRAQDFLLKDLKSCTIVLKGVVRALRLQNLEDTVVFAGPSIGPAYVQNCDKCALSLAAQQLRIHGTTATQFFLWTVAGPIIEDCSELKFSPYEYAYDEFWTDLQESKLESKENAWASVKDFRWLKAQSSPNFELLPAGQAEALSHGIAALEMQGCRISSRENEQQE